MELIVGCIIIMLVVVRSEFGVIVFVRSKLEVLCFLLIFVYLIYGFCRVVIIIVDMDCNKC